ncbi:phosphotransferase [Qingshengfaniella alkalisoli]|uniref:Phosphotransferase n=1 Tax=Qingshengfaniella alkalisoli TaxID=2599296 RepID=A0A5B8J0A1_9RHOB|nr:phosphotransferase [Qingshengfaniella alkalisoli]QDY70611.1 phosphotransferase [Qingshengfaniella alkalisoli]
MAKPPRVVRENLQFLCAEIDGQLSGARSYFQDPDAGRAQKVILRAGYGDNLRARVQSASQRALSAKGATETSRLLLENMDMVARNLDLISRLARRSLIHAEKVNRTALLRPSVYPKIVKGVATCVADIMPAIASSDSKLALGIGQSKAQLDDFYDQMFRTYTRDMQKSHHTADLANALLAVNEIRRMGDALQSIGEAILSVNIGQSVRFERYFTLRSILSATDTSDDAPDLEPLAETRSGSAISAVQSKDEKGETLNAVFKDGTLKKVREERAGVKSWNSIYPGLAPKILSYEKRGQSAALLIEHLPGQTFEQILLNESDARLQEAQKALSKTLRDIWKSTRTDEPAKMASMDQLAGRMKEVRRIHPDFDPVPVTVGAVELPDFDSLVVEAAKREKALPAPFSVHIHGDFNLDNVIYDHLGRKIRFIDLHRSRYMDYVQDVSVFMVSNYRLQIQDGPVRERIAQVVMDFHATATKFARSQKDQTFEYRLALGLARSFATSTRFTLERSHARRMFVRSRFLLERVLECPQGREGRFKLPIKELFSD